MKQIYDHRVQGHVRQELESGAKGPFVDEDANELSRQRFRGAGFEPFPDLAQCRQPELIADSVPELRRDGGAVRFSWHR
jgi:hypothetical protein